MGYLKVHHLGPVRDCEFTVNQFLTVTGAQASGKSTIAKSVFFFWTVKDDLLKLVVSRAARQQRAAWAERLPISTAVVRDSARWQRATGTAEEKDLVSDLNQEMTSKFLGLFGPIWGMETDLSLSYQYNETAEIRIYLQEDAQYPGNRQICFEYSHGLLRFFRTELPQVDPDPAGISEETQKYRRESIAEVFSDSCTVVYIPAGRSALSVFSGQLSYLYSTVNIS